MTKGEGRRWHGKKETGRVAREDALVRGEIDGMICIWSTRRLCLPRRLLLSRLISPQPSRNDLSRIESNKKTLVREGRPLCGPAMALPYLGSGKMYDDASLLGGLPCAYLHWLLNETLVVGNHRRSRVGKEDKKRQRNKGT